MLQTDTSRNPFLFRAAVLALVAEDFVPPAPVVIPSCSGLRFSLWVKERADERTKS